MTYLMGAADGFTLEDDELTFESDVAGTFTALVYAVDSTPERQKIATAYVTATVS